MIKTLIPDSLHLQTSEDGVCLHFKTKSGKRVAINLSEPAIDPVASAVIKAWAQEYAKHRLPPPLLMDSLS